MVELNKTYHIGVKKFGFVNWIGFKSLWLKECNRFMAVWQQTLLSPLVSSLLFLSVLSLALGNNRGDVLGHSFISFLKGKLNYPFFNKDFKKTLCMFTYG